MPARGNPKKHREANTVIQTLTHLPHPHEDGATLASHFTDLAPPLTARQLTWSSALRRARPAPPKS